MTINKNTINPIEHKLSRHEKEQLINSEMNEYKEDNKNE